MLSINIFLQIPGNREEAQISRVWVLLLPFICCETLEKLPNFSVPQRVFGNFANL